MKILAAYPYFPDSRTRVRSFETLKLLASLGDVTVVFAAKDSGVHIENPLDIPCRVISVPDSRGKRLARVFGAVATQKTITYAFYRNAADVFAQENSVPFDLVFVERLPITQAIKKMGQALIYDAVDSFEVQTMLLARSSGGFKKVGYGYDSMRIKREQVGICNQADGVICTTTLEQKRLEGAGVSSPIHAYLHTSQVSRVSSLGMVKNKSRPLAVFHGRGSYAANHAAGQRIRNQIAPAAPRADFLVFGSDWPVTESANLRVLGFQRDLALLRTADFAIFPLDVAVGVQNKVIEALAAGLPCVVTPVVADGLPAAIKEGLKSRLHLTKLDEFPAYVARNADRLMRDELAADAFESIYTDLIARERSAVVDFIDRTLVRKGAGFAPVF